MQFVMQVIRPSSGNASSISASSSARAGTECTPQVDPSMARCAALDKSPASGIGVFLCLNREMGAGEFFSEFMARRL